MVPRSQDHHSLHSTNKWTEVQDSFGFLVGRNSSGTHARRGHRISPLRGIGSRSRAPENFGVIQSNSGSLVHDSWSSRRCRGAAKQGTHAERGYQVESRRCEPIFRCLGDIFSAKMTQPRKGPPRAPKKRAPRINVPVPFSFLNQHRLVVGITNRSNLRPSGESSLRSLTVLVRPTVRRLARRDHNTKHHDGAR